MNQPPAKKLVGHWITDPQDTESIREFGRVSLQFSEDGQLIHTIFGAESAQKMLLTFRVEDEMIITDQPSAPQEERTRFQLTPEGKLILVHGGQRSVFIRQGTAEPGQSLPSPSLSSSWTRKLASLFRRN